MSYRSLVSTFNMGKSIKTEVKPPVASSDSDPNHNVQCITLDSENDNVGYPKSLLRKLYKAALEGVDTDVIIVFGKFDENAPTAHVHSSILKSESSVFKAWMSAECWNGEFMKSADGKTMISLPADDPEEFRSFLKLLYGQKGLIKKDELHLVAIPAFRMADKYGALDVMKICEEECFPVLIKNLKNMNAAEVLSFAQKYDVTVVSDAVVEFVKKDPVETLVEGKYAGNWASSGEEVLVRLLSTDSYRLQTWLGWGENEKQLCNLASRWLRIREAFAVEKEDEKAEDDPPSTKRTKVAETPSIAVRVFQNIRFLQMSAEQLKTCLQDLNGLLTPQQIGTICLVCSGISQDNIKAPEVEEDKFVVNTKMRYVSRL